jgi:co-chaperonin GroES (HSP10)
MTVGRDKVLVERGEAPKTTRGGLLDIPDAARERPDYGTVIAVGWEVTDWHVGDKVIYPKWSGFMTTIPGDDRDLLILFANEIWMSI